MNEWKKQIFNRQNIKAETDKAILVQMPHKSKYDGFSFWHPKKITWNGAHDYEIIISYTDNFIFKLKKYGKGKYNSNEVIKELEISAEEFGDALN